MLEVGGGSGVHAEWLAQDGYQVELVDPVPLHVDQAARIPGVTARLGDARELPACNAAYDAVLMLGPLYHLPERTDRVQALAEAYRAVRPGGPVVAATINRYARLHDLLREERYFVQLNRERTDAVLAADGRHPYHHDAFFTVAHFAQPDEVPEEFTDAGLTTGLPIAAAPQHGQLWGESGEYGRRWGARGENRLHIAART